MTFLFNFLDLFKLQFVVNAFFAIILLAISSSLSGTYLIHKKMSFLTPGIAHAAFAGVVLAFLVHWNIYVTASVFAFLVVLFIEFVKVKGNLHSDSSIGVVFTFEMALAILFIGMLKQYTPEVYTFLFGNVLTITPAELVAITIMTAIIAVFFIVFYRYIVLIIFDEEMAKFDGINVELFDMIFLFLIALNIIFSLKSVGTILIFAYLLIPPTIAYQQTHNFKKLLWLSILYSIISSVIGFIFSIMFNLPSGATIVITMTVILFIIMIFFNEKKHCKECLTRLD